MKILRLLTVLNIIAIFSLSGCGNGGGDVHGDLTVTATSSAVTNGTASVSFTITYTRPEGGPYDGLDVEITTTLDGNTIDSGTEVFSSSGSLILTYSGVPAGSIIRLQAKVGDIVRSASLTVASSTLTITPATDWNFTTGAAAGTSKAGTISGGTAPFTVSSSTTDLTPSISAGNILTVTLNVAAPGGQTGTITVRDSSGQTGLVSVSY
jgi:hypothetical protein